MASGSHDLAGEYLPLYLTDDTPAEDLTMRDLIGALRRSLNWPVQEGPVPAPPATRSARTLSPVFCGVVGLDPARVEMALRSRGQAGMFTVRRRLRLQPAVGNLATGWVMAGRLKRLTTFYWIPVVVEMWSVGGGVTRVTMVPQRPVLASKRYFRLGHDALKGLSAELLSSDPPPVLHA